MQYGLIGTREVSRFGLGTKRLPTTDASRVVRLDAEAASGIIDSSLSAGVNFFDTSYVNMKGAAEAFLGDHLKGRPMPCYVSTSYFRMVDPRYEYVFQKQLKKLSTSCIDFYSVEGISDLTKAHDIDSGAIDFLFERKDAGEIGLLGFSSELNPDNLNTFLSLYPWDFVRMRVNYYDWFVRDLRACYETARFADMPIIAHAPTRIGAMGCHEPKAADLLEEAAPGRSTAAWALLFVKSLPGVQTVSCNAQSVAEVVEDAAIFDNDMTLSGEEIELLEKVAHIQKAR